MKILVFASYFHPHKGGYEIYIQELYKKFVEDDGHFVDVVTCNTEHVKEFEVIGGVNVYRVSCYNIINNKYPIPKIIPTIRLLRKLSKTRYNFVNTHTRFWVSSFLGYLFSKFTKTKLVHTEHGSQHTEFDNTLIKIIGRVYDHTLGALIVKSAFKNVGISKAACLFLGHLGAKNICLIPNGVNTSVFRRKKTDLRKRLGIPRDYKIITFVGRLIYAKGVQDLISVFLRVRKDHKTKLLIVGEGDYKKKLSGLSNNNEDIIFLGERDDITDILNITSLFVNPSYSEGLPTSVLEALAVGVPVIATDVGGTKELVNKKFLVPPKERERLYKAIITLLSTKPPLVCFEKRKWDYAIIKDKLLRVYYEST